MLYHLRNLTRGNPHTNGSGKGRLTHAEEARSHAATLDAWYALNAAESDADTPEPEPYGPYGREARRILRLDD